MRWLRRFILTITTALLLWGGAVGIGAIFPGRSFPAQPLGQDAPVSVGLSQGLIHTDFLLPLDKATQRDFAVLKLPEGARWLLVGWGARDFYTTVGDYGDIGLSPLFRAITGDDAVMRYEPVNEYNPVLTIDLSPLEYEQLRKIILSDTDFTQPVGNDLLQPGDKYFAAKGRFNAINTCNQWIARSLSRSGRSFGAWTQTTWAVRLSLWLYG